eukprot:6201856-Pleurochrysis_carterae.AAC.3
MPPPVSRVEWESSPLPREIPGPPPLATDRGGLVDSARRRFGCTSRTDSSSKETSRRVSATLPEASDVMRGAKSSSTLCTVLHARGGGHDVARKSSGAEMPLLPATSIGAMHFVMIAASILSRSRLHAVRPGGARSEVFEADIAWLHPSIAQSA